MRLDGGSCTEGVSQQMICNGVASANEAHLHAAVHLKRDARFMPSCIMVGLAVVELLLPLSPSINNSIK
jgi:hypothetical protein